jgi:hypothetical protein
MHRGICCRLCGDPASSLYNTYHLTVVRLNGVAAGILIAAARAGFSLLASVTANEFRESIFKLRMWRFSQL